VVRATETDVALDNVDAGWVVAVVGGDDGDEEDVDGDDVEQLVADGSEPVADGPTLFDGTVADDSTHLSEVVVVVAVVVAFVVLASR
jgi:hypothetical protein